ncbi:hypothetical protein AVEN_73856-1 [Araneus ventricosus]|uniref:Uncharacterized protein n=1 Tax=Araneus ventricosus TaxID=182803 RepID=A0A4Y2GEN7_ARAVE|nr:hypothetical protein AVEN_73856-1 [Araneus ventricosus]
MERCISEIYLLLSEFNWLSGYRVSFRTGRSRVLSWVVFVLCFCYSLQCKLALQSSSYGDFEACVNLLQACFTLVVTNLQKACRLAVQVCCKLKLLSGSLQSSTLKKRFQEFVAFKQPATTSLIAQKKNTIEELFMYLTLMIFVIH